MRRFGLNPYLELIYQLFEKSYFRYFRTFLGPLGPNFQSFLSGELYYSHISDTHCLFVTRWSRILNIRDKMIPKLNICGKVFLNLDHSRRGDSENWTFATRWFRILNFSDTVILNIESLRQRGPDSPKFTLKWSEFWIFATKWSGILFFSLLRPIWF